MPGRHGNQRHDRQAKDGDEHQRRFDIRIETALGLPVRNAVDGTLMMQFSVTLDDALPEHPVVTEHFAHP